MRRSFIGPEEVGQAVREARKKLGVTQKDLAFTSGTGVRFIIDLERGKPTCHLGKTLLVLRTLGIQISLTPPPSDSDEQQGGL